MGSLSLESWSKICKWISGGKVLRVSLWPGRVNRFSLHWRGFGDLRMTHHQQTSLNVWN
jgi:hypothetical protein